MESYHRAHKIEIFYAAQESFNMSLWFFLSQV